MLELIRYLLPFRIQNNYGPGLSPYSWSSNIFWSSTIFKCRGNARAGRTVTGTWFHRWTSPLPLSEGQSYLPPASQKMLHQQNPPCSYYYRRMSILQVQTATQQTFRSTIIICTKLFMPLCISSSKGWFQLCNIQETLLLINFLPVLPEFLPWECDRAHPKIWF